jgi:hypothetical protein
MINSCVLRRTRARSLAAAVAHAEQSVRGQQKQQQLASKQLKSSAHYKRSLF